MAQAYNVLIVTEFNDIREEDEKEILERLEEHGVEKIPTVGSAWEMKCEAEDESEAKDQAIQTFINVARTYPFELKIVVHCGVSQILRRRKKFDP